MSKKAKAGSPTTGGKDPEEQSERVEEARPSDIPLTTETKGLGGVRTATDNPCASLTYDQYKEDMIILARFVDEPNFWSLGNPDNIKVTSEVLYDQYFEACPMLKMVRLSRTAICQTLDRWSVSPGRLRERPLGDDLETVIGVGNTGQITGYTMLDELYKMMRMCERQCDPYHERPDEPAVFWKTTGGYLDPLPRDKAPMHLSERGVPYGAGRYAAFGPIPNKYGIPVSPKEAESVMPSRNVPLPRKEVVSGGASDASGAVVMTGGARSIQKKARVEFGDAEHGEIREQDLAKVMWLAESYLSRFLCAVVIPYKDDSESAKRYVTKWLPLLRKIVLQSKADARFGLDLVRAPLFRKSVFTSGLESIALGKTTDVIIVIPVDVGRQEFDSTTFPRELAYWRSVKLEGQQRDGFLSEHVKNEWHSKLQSFEKSCGRVLAVCDELMSDMEVVEFEDGRLVPKFRLSVEFDAGRLIPKFQLTGEKHYNDDEVVMIRIPEQRQLLAAVGQQDDEARSVTSEVSEQRSTKSSDSSVSSVSSKGAVTAEEMQEKWLQSYSAYSVAVPCPARVFNSKGEADALSKLQPLQKIDVKSILKLVDQLKKLHLLYKDAAVQWVLVIDETIEPIILTKFAKLFPDENVVDLSGINSRKMVKVLGRLCEASDWHVFKQQVKDSVPTMKQSDGWDEMQGVLLMLTLLVPLFGRRLDGRGANLHYREASFNMLLTEILPRNFIVPILDMFYEQSQEQFEKNVSFGLPRLYTEWSWGAHSLLFILMLKGEIADESELDREADQRRRKFQQQGSTSRSVHSVQNDEGDVVHDDESAVEVSDEHQVSAIGGKSQGYGKSGSGSPTLQLENAIRRSSEKSVRFQQQGSRDHQGFRSQQDSRDQPKICFNYSIDNTSCAFGNQCKYKHLDASKPEELQQLLEHLRRQAQEKRMHLVDTVDNTSAAKAHSGDVDKED